MYRQRCARSGERYGGGDRPVPSGAPKTIIKDVREILEISKSEDAGHKAKGKPKKLTEAERTAEIAKLEQEMKEASKLLEFEYAAVLRDRIIELRGGK